MTLIRLFYILILLCLLWAYAGYCFGSIKDPNGLADANDLIGLAVHWLEPGQPVKVVFSFEGIVPHTWTQNQTDGTILVIRSESLAKQTITGIKYRPVGMNEFKEIAMRWKGDPNWKPLVIPDIGKIEPNEPPDPCEPNLAEMLEGVTDKGLITAIKELMK
jgi:hypothetical protein